jgi:hypothetical protein
MVMSSLPAHNVGRKTLKRPGSTSRGQATGEVRKADEAYEQRLAAAIEEAGLPEIPPTTEQSRFLYGELSQAAHHRRRWTLDSVTPALRTMIIGPTDNWLRRAGTAAAMLGVVEECVISVGGCLSAFCQTVGTRRRSCHFSRRSPV